MAVRRQHGELIAFQRQDAMDPLPWKCRFGELFGISTISTNRVEKFTTSGLVTFT